MGTLFKLLFIFIWVKRLFWLITLPFRMVREMVSDFGKFFRFVIRLFTPSFWSSLHSWVLDGHLASLGKKIALAAVFLVLGLGALILAAGFHHAVNARGGEAAAASPAPPADAAKHGGGPREVRRALAVTAPGNPPTPPNAAPASSAPPPTAYVVAGIAAGDCLNVHSGPGMNHPVTARLANGFGGIQIVGPPVRNGQTPWVPIRFGERTGWVAPSYLQPQ